MNDELKYFLEQLAGGVGTSVLAVVFAAFIAIPWQLQHPPGEIDVQATLEWRHMT